MVRRNKRTAYRVVGGPPVQVGGYMVVIGQHFGAEALDDDHLLELLLASGQVVEDGILVDEPGDAEPEPDGVIADDTAAVPDDMGGTD